MAESDSRTGNVSSSHAFHVGDVVWCTHPVGVTIGLQLPIDPWYGRILLFCDDGRYLVLMEDVDLAIGEDATDFSAVCGPEFVFGDFAAAERHR